MNADKFLEIYNKLDAFMRNEIDKDQFMSFSSLLREFIADHPIFRRYEEDIKLYSLLRNAIVHDPFKPGIDPIAEPNLDTLNRFQSIYNEITNPPKAFDKAIKNIYKTTLLAKVSDVMTEMNDKRYTYVPVIDKNQLIGIFSENTLFSYLIHKNPLNDQILMRDLGEYIPLEKHRNEYFKFVDRDCLFWEAEEMFKETVNNGKRLAVVYITEHGRKEEYILGMLTAWDVAGN